MDLVNVEVMGFARAILDCPILHRSDIGNDGWWIIHVKDARLVALQRDKELAGSVAAGELFREVQVTGRGWGQVEQSGKALALGRWFGCRLHRMYLLLWVVGAENLDQLLRRIGIAGRTPVVAVG